MSARTRPHPIGILLLLILPGMARAAESPGRHTLDSSGVKISYAVQGEGEPVVLVHGWLSSAAINWDLPGTTAMLAQKYRVVTFDVPGHGQSDAPTDERAYGQELVVDVVRLLDHLQIDKAHIVGYSMGGIIAGNFIAKHPERVISGTLGGMGWLKEGGFGQRGFQRIGRREENAAAKAICGRSLAKLALTEEQIKLIRVPMIVIVGADDRMIHRLYVDPLQRAARLAGGRNRRCQSSDLHRQAAIQGRTGRLAGQEREVRRALPAVLTAWGRFRARGQRLAGVDGRFGGGG